MKPQRPIILNFALSIDVQQLQELLEQLLLPAPSPPSLPPSSLPRREPLLTARELGAALKVSTRTIQLWGKEGMPSYQGDRMQRYKQSETEQWLRNRVRKKRSDSGTVRRDRQAGPSSQEEHRESPHLY